MLKRLKNLYELSKYKPEQIDDKVLLKEDLDKRPKGQAIVLPDEPVDFFAQGDNSQPPQEQ